MKRLIAWLLLAALLSCAAGCSAPEEPSAPYSVEISEGELREIFSQGYEAPKNVILMIADGMGQNDLILCEQFSEDLFDFGLVLNQIPYHGLATTYSADHAITDSAAAATALATGVKTDNGMIGQTPAGDPLKNISEIARERGKRIGIVTTDLATGATPASFTVHNESRNNTEALAKSLAEFAPDLLMGQSYSSFNEVLDKDGKKLLGEYHLSKSSETLEAALDAAGDQPCFCFSDDFTWERADDTLARYTEAALNHLENEEGFFLMVESSGTDKCGHANNMEGKLNSVVTFDRAVAVVLKFMRDHPDTLLLITSDHETGGVRLPKEGEPLSDALFTTTKHTAADVRVFALGQGAEYFHQKTVDNTDIAKFAINAVKGE